jgi:hypothetical protein
MPSRLTCLTLAALLAAAPTACGGGGRPRAATPAAPAAPRYLDRHDLALQLGNGFRERLARLAVMEQPRDDATDLGQDLPAGLLRDVRCAPAAPVGAAGRRRPWTCRVRWETAAGRPRTLRYAVTLLPTGCFGAAATPRLPDHFDPTINTYAEHPLETIVSVRNGC